MNQLSFCDYFADHGEYSDTQMNGGMVGQTDRHES